MHARPMRGTYIHATEVKTTTMPLARLRHKELDVLVGRLGEMHVLDGLLGLVDVVWLDVELGTSAVRR